ncbi:DegT/DnrJ/EryC1/StrS family aminotransferase [Dethiosulfatarculus sandiegensis]|uniref:DegT/DnrJ/EryC1/StrS family aminotransferase n=1 Tax=Dethiosulfatarculus sandiegensis TaxID=1429043 RepID=UPI0005C82F39|nr:DegT/DnrJ/EryC1/StrS family aminotransferase [Dethiosulfatarculus sandiegensis]
MKKIPLIKPYINNAVKEKVLAVLDSGYLTEGPVARELEKAMADYLGAKHALAVSSCTTGLEMALRALKVGPGDEVIIPDYTYPATGDVVSIVGARLLIVDVDPQTMLMDFEALERAITPATKVVMPVSGFGNPLDYDALDSLKEKHGFYVVEDAACSLGASYKGDMVGTRADISVFSLHPRKFITTGEGGMITTDSDHLADWMHSYKHFGMGVYESRLTADFQRIGTNYKLSDILAAVGLAQMQEIDVLLNRRRELAERYLKLLSNTSKVKPCQVAKGGVHSFQSFCVFVENRDEVMANMREKGVEVQIGTYALHMHKAFNQNPDVYLTDDMKGSRYVFDHCLALPLFHELTYKEQVFIVNLLLKVAS